MDDPGHEFEGRPSADLPPEAEYQAAESIEDDWPAPEPTTTDTGEWVKSCGCPGGENEHSLTCGEVQRYL